MNMKKILFTLMVVAILACPAMAQRYRQFQVMIVDEFGDAVTNIDQIEIQDAGTSTTSTIYPTRAGGTMTNPITTSSTASTFVQSLGLVSWFQSAASYKIIVTESGASQSLTIDNQDETDTRFPFYANYIGEAATLQTTDDANLDIGTGDDFTHDWDNTNSRYIIHAASDDSGTLHFGKAALHNDIYWHTGAAISTDYVLFDEGSANVQFIDVDLLIDDEAKILIGDSSDVTIEYDESNEDLDITSTTALDLITFGATADSFDLEWWTGSAGDKILWDESEAEMYLTDTDIMWDDDADAIFGSDEDFIIECDTTKVLEVLPLAATDDYKVYLGVDQSGVDLKAFGTTSGDYFEWDASADTVTIVGDAVAWTLTEAASTAVNIDITGAAGGFDLDTTNGNIALTAGNASNGDILLTAGDDFTETVTGIWFADVTGQAKLTSSSDAASSVLITEDGGTSGQVRLHADTGTHNRSIYALSDVGGILIEASAGSVGINATGATAGDLGFTVGDDFTNTVTGIWFSDVTGQAKLTSSSNAASSVLITEDGGTSGQIRLHADTGTHAKSVYVLSDVGGIDVTASAGSIGLNATGASAGDITLTSGDDFTLATTGSSTLGKIYYQRQVKFYSSRNASITSGDSGAVICGTPTIQTLGTQLFELPTAAVGLTYTFIDLSSVATNDVFIRPASGDSIDSHVSSGDGKCIASLQDTAGPTVTLVAVTTGSWITIGGSGTWSLVGYN